MYLGSPDDNLFHLSLLKLVNRKTEGCKGLKVELRNSSLLSKLRGISCELL
jgi:hypothetical protein